MIRLGIIGLGYWGPNLLRCFEANRHCKVVVTCDRDTKRLEQIGAQFPTIRRTTESDEVLDSDVVDAVVIATPTRTHHRLATQALEAGLHVFVEKPLATSTEECRELIALADDRQRTLFVGHVFLHSTPVQALRELVASGELGDLYYIASKRLNLGPVRHDVNALWDLAPHDLSIMLDLIGHSPASVSCSGLAYLNPRVHDVCNLTLNFADQKMGIVHTSWLDPRKDRVMTVVGSKKMAVYNDLEPLEKIKVYDIGIDALPYPASYGEFQFSYRYGNTFSPRLNEAEPLMAECSDFIRCIRDGERPYTDGRNGMAVVEVLEAADKSLSLGGARVALADAVSRSGESPSKSTAPVASA
ncbi:MAG: Gfo/Idh/MocA family oxidoreductase [Planctomycetales bacterium]|nr:Gfo/Idh/MocA family oxidoreductase [Planctomycetales bacterium]